MQQNAIKLIIVAGLMNNGFIYVKALLPRAKTFFTQLYPHEKEKNSRSTFANSFQASENP